MLLNVLFAVLMIVTLSETRLATTTSASSKPTPQGSTAAGSFILVISNESTIPISTVERISQLPGEHVGEFAIPAESFCQRPPPSSVKNDSEPGGVDLPGVSNIAGLSAIPYSSIAPTAKLPF